MVTVYTEEEIQDLLHLDFADYIRKYPNRTVDGANRKRQRLLKQEEAVLSHTYNETTIAEDVKDNVWHYILKVKQHGTSIEELGDLFKLYPGQVRSIIDELKLQSHTIIVNKFGEVSIPVASINPQNPILQLPDPGKVFRFGVIGDTHLVSIDDRLDALNTYYDRIKLNGIELVLHAGDLFDGMNVYKGHNNNIRFSGFDRHLEYGLNEYPYRAGVRTVFIGGNHDESFIKLAGIDPVARFCHDRDDAQYIGLYDGVVDIGGVKVELHHGHGYSYAQSYQLQKYVEKIPVGDRPHLFACGHWHHAVAMLGYQGIDSLSVGCFQGRTGLLSRIGGYPTIGGWIVEVEHDKDKLVRTKLEFIHLD